MDDAGFMSSTVWQPRPPGEGGPMMLITVRCQNTSKEIPPEEYLLFQGLRFGDFSDFRTFGAMVSDPTLRQETVQTHQKHAKMNW